MNLILMQNVVLYNKIMVGKPKHTIRLMAHSVVHVHHIPFKFDYRVGKDYVSELFSHTYKMRLNAF